MLVGLVTFSLAFGGPNVGKRPLLRQATPRMLLPDVSELTNMPHVASAVSALSAPSMLLSGSITPPAVAGDATGLFSLAEFSAPEVTLVATEADAWREAVAVIFTIVTGFSLAFGWTYSQTTKVCDRPPPHDRPPPAAHLAAADTDPPPHHTLSTPLY